jgi:hypothetical protein
MAVGAGLEGLEVNSFTYQTCPYKPTEMQLQVPFRPQLVSVALLTYRLEPSPHPSPL